MATQLTLDGEDVPHEGVPNTADPRKLGYVGSAPNAPRDSDAWFTPQKYVDAARAALGGIIALDPFSSAAANQVVRAQRYFTESDNAFVKMWFPDDVQDVGRTVWMNPPYGASLISEAMAKFLAEFEAQSFDRGIILVNNATETKWFQKALSRASAVTFTDHRISFWNADGKAVSGNTRGQAFFYFGDDPSEFLRYFQQFGFACPLPGAPEPETIGQPEEMIEELALPLTF